MKQQKPCFGRMLKFLHVHEPTGYEKDEEHKRTAMRYLALRTMLQQCSDIKSLERRASALSDDDSSASEKEEEPAMDDSAKRKRRSDDGRHQMKLQSYHVPYYYNDSSDHTTTAKASTSQQSHLQGTIPVQSLPADPELRCLQEASAMRRVFALPSEKKTEREASSSRKSTRSEPSKPRGGSRSAKGKRSPNSSRNGVVLPRTAPSYTPFESQLTASTSDLRNTQMEELEKIRRLFEENNLSSRLKLWSEDCSSRKTNARLKEALQALQERYDRLDTSTTKQIQDLTDENELLAEANRLLLEKQAQNPPTSSKDAPSLLQVPDELLLPGPALAIRQLVVLDNVHSFGNLLSVSAHATRPEIVITGGADNGNQCPGVGFGVNPKREFADYFVAAGMDATHTLYRLEQQGEQCSVHTVCEFHDHNRHGAFKLAWSASGLLFATGSSDKSLNIYQCSQLNGAGQQAEKIKSFYFNGTVEAMVFAPSGLEISELLVIAVRDDCYVHYVDCSTFEKERINMNPDGIEHVSYTIMDLSLSPSGKYLLAPRIPIATSSSLQPRAVWHPSEKYVISNNEENGTIFVWSIASEQVVETFDAHDALVRDLVCPTSSVSPMLVTVSYDKRMKIWESSLAGIEIM
ncbi:WD40 repeat, conserved site [Phytophthora cactorum]|nr:WD40 repeat, conserved site [Phytophthora cactorum]